MSVLYFTLFLFALPFLIFGTGLLAVTLTGIIMTPFMLVFMFFLYKGDWREMFDMEFGTSFRDRIREKPARFSRQNVVNFIRK